ncbi:MarR family winged helix-turn-helix transcriptional regulator [Alkalilacustris brevis]|uniref:MarR family winged helix-turn-helix transcriptional regulator n=1 Tax=Alkalilacustris brevis TaxID=2026338 RepID=UPI00192E4BC8|nr:MarR family transcriptional regulator [Alkalilacustris brevis]
MVKVEKRTEQMTSDSWRQDNVGRFMNQAAKLFEQRVIELMHAKGFREIGTAHVNLTRHLDKAGNRLTELAARADMTKQSMRELVAHTELAGLVERRPDPSDGRAKIIAFTPVGLRWLDAFGESVRTAEREMSAVIGPTALAQLKQALKLYAAECADRKE